MANTRGTPSIGETLCPFQERLRHFPVVARLIIKALIEKPKIGSKENEVSTSIFNIVYKLVSSHRSICI